jgi:hypothetical protein
VIKGDNYLTPSVPLSLKGEGEEIKKEASPLLDFLFQVYNVGQKLEFFKISFVCSQATRSE